MTEPVPEASDADLAEQSVPVDDAAEDVDVPADDLSMSAEADPADLLEQHQSVPSPDDDYDR
jgi:hypothetical protein